MRHVRRPGARVLESLRWRFSVTNSPAHIRAIHQSRCLSSHSHSLVHRLSRFWTPTENQAKSSDKSEDVHATLVRAGFLRQTHSGIFHLLPLGFRVQQKLESLIDYHMERISASKVALSTISSEKLWRTSGRLTGKDSELFRLKDRKDAKLLLSPTHEEEITSLVATSVHSYRDLPLRLYQVTRKYRDEARPRQGLLRGREFLMKDLYTFDSTVEKARQTYDQVRAAYHNFFTDLRIPFLTAAADSGSMGGSLSHEYHLPSPSGEDNIITCSACSETMNEEVAVIPFHSSTPQVAANEIETDTWHCISTDRRTLIRVLYPRFPFSGPFRPNMPNIYAIRAAIPDYDLDFSSSSDPESLFQATDGTKQILLHDPRLLVPPSPASPFTPISAPSLLTTLQAGDPCPSCSSGHLSIVPAIEVGHTFHLGERYSAPLKLAVKDATDTLVNVQMGCHGIGVSRLIAAIAAVKTESSSSGRLAWPAAVAPFCVVVVPGKGNESAAETVAAELQSYLTKTGRGDVVLDDRDKPLGWKFKDADLIGYPVVVVVGRAYAGSGEVEVQCRQLGVKENLPAEFAEGQKTAPSEIASYLARL